MAGKANLISCDCKSCFLPKHMILASYPKETKTTSNTYVAQNVFTITLVVL